MLEIACFNASSAISAAQAGADRIELCADYAVGGRTPHIDSLHSIRAVTSVPVNVMIRPRAGNFQYSEEEFEQMKAEIEVFKPSASGFVFGILDPDKGVDEARNRELVELAAPLPCTFHRAIDEVGNLDEAVRGVIRCGFRSILTSGGERNAVEGAGRVARLQEMFGEKITFIIGGGIRRSNVKELRRETAVSWVHSAAITTPSEEVDNEEVRKMREILLGSA